MNILVSNSAKTHARIAGLLYLLIAVFGGFSMGYLPSVLDAPGDPTATANNILTHQGLVRFGIFADLIVGLLEIALTAMLFVLLAPVNKTLAYVAAFARLIMVAVIAMTALFDIIPLLLLTQPAFGAAFDAAQLYALVILFVQLEHYGVAIWQVFFTVHLLALGYLVIRSGYWPRVLGVMMMVGSFGYTFDSIEKITAISPDGMSIVTVVFLTIVTIAEISFCLWLLIKGMNTDAWEKVNHRRA